MTDRPSEHLLPQKIPYNRRREDRPWINGVGFDRINHRFDKTDEAVQQAMTRADEAIRLSEARTTTLIKWIFGILLSAAMTSGGALLAVLHDQEDDHKEDMSKISDKLEKFDDRLRGIELKLPALTIGVPNFDDE